MENTAITLFIMFSDVYKTIFTFASFFSNIVCGVFFSVDWPLHDCTSQKHMLYGPYEEFKVYAEYLEKSYLRLMKPPFDKTDFKLNDLQVFLTNENKPFQIWISVIKILQSLSFAFRGLMSSHPLLLNVVR